MIKRWQNIELKTHLQENLHVKALTLYIFYEGLKTGHIIKERSSRGKMIIYKCQWKLIFKTQPFIRYIFPSLSNHDNSILISKLISFACGFYSLFLPPLLSFYSTQWLLQMQIWFIEMTHGSRNTMLFFYYWFVTWAIDVYKERINLWLSEELSS